MREILILGRGGQGAQTAGNQLARAYFDEGQYVQTFATYGGARRGTPVASSIRVDDQPVRLRCDIEYASAMLCFDDTLLEESFLRRANEKTLIVVNSTRSREAFSGLGDYRIYPVNGKDIARNNDMGKVVNSALLGAFVATLDKPDIETMCEVIEETAPAKKEQNVAACREAYLHIRNSI
ncbi:MAG: 2-oxoacid:acceptor oxidoreductase family protein [Rhodospirillales bacterium]|nr:2-oxoacid:acceptor oxidoreductase family protein [Rhodospirillales bacterium]